MKDCQKKSSLSETPQELVRHMQEMGFGTIEDLFVKDGLPILDPAPKIVHGRKYTSGRAVSRSLSADFVLKDEVVQLFSDFDRYGSGFVRRIQVAHGLPIHMEIDPGA